MRNAPVIDYRAALSALATIREAVEARKTAAIAIVDSHGELVAFVRMDGVLLSRGHWRSTSVHGGSAQPAEVLGETLRARGPTSRSTAICVTWDSAAACRCSSTASSQAVSASAGCRTKKTKRWLRGRVALLQGNPPPASAPDAR
jgi:hypothetical protein